MEDNEPCAVCSAEVGQGMRAVACDGCHGWYHQACGKISDYIYKKIADAPNEEPYMWYCKDCKPKCKKSSNNKLSNKCEPIDQGPHKVGSPKTRAENVSLHRDNPNNIMTFVNVSSQPLDQHNARTLTSHHPENEDVTNLGLLLAETGKENQYLKSTILQLYRDLQEVHLLLVNAKERNLELTRETIQQGKTITRLNNHIQHLDPIFKPTRPMTVPTSENGNPKNSYNDQSIRTDLLDKAPTETTIHRPPEDTTADILIIGDSMIRGLLHHQDLGPNKKIKVHSMPGARIQNLSKYLVAQEALPHTVIVHIGTNNLKNSKTPNHVMRPLWYTLESAQKKFKNTIWVVNAILYRNDIQRKYIDDVNDALQFMCDQLKLVFRNPNTAVTGRGIGRDGLHLNSLGERQLTDFIMSDIGVQLDLDIDPSSIDNETVPAPQNPVPTTTTNSKNSTIPYLKTTP